MFRRRTRADEPAPPDQFQQWVSSLSPRWRPPVDRAVETRDRFLTVLGQSEPGPARDRLDGLRPTIDEAVQRVAETVWRAANAEAIASGFDVDVANSELKAARRDLDAARHSGTDMAGFEDRVRVLSERHRAIHDALNLAEDVGSRIDEMNVRLETLVARSASIVLRTTSGDSLDEVDRELKDVVVGITALDDSLRAFD